MGRQTPDPRSGGAAAGTVEVHAATYPVTILGVRRPVYVTGAADEKIGTIAEHQRGRVSRDQLRAAGVSDRMIHGRVAAGRLVRKHRAVYAVGHTAPAPLTAEVEALLACGPHAVLSQNTAARLWKLIPDWDTSIHVTIRGRHGAQPDGVRVHHTNRLTRGEVEIVDALPVTSVARTLIDFAASADLTALERAIEQALIAKHVTDAQLDRAAAARVGRGATRIRAILAQQREPGVTRSEAERRFRALMRAAQLPEPRTNIRIHGVEPDAYWPELGVVVEVQSQKFHLTRAALERDTRKAAKLTAAGLTVSYVTWTQMEREPFAVVARVAQLLARAAAQTRAAT
jgi:predicted transcriptional regulator of viral defense system